MSALFTDEVCQTLRRTLAYFVDEIYDDPFDVDRDEVVRLEVAGRFLGVDIWDLDQMERLVGSRVTDFEYERLKTIRG